jgi:hypothetical protein
MEDKRTKIAQQFYQWAVREMEFQPSPVCGNSKPLTLSDLKKICRGDLINIWSYLINCVRSER